MTYGVFIEFWQQQCCGKPFGVDSHVEWAVNWRVERYPTLDRILGAEAAAQVELLEDHHSADERTDGIVRGVVTRLEVVTAESVVRDTTVHLVDGTGKLRPIDQLDPWEPQPKTDDDSWSFLGWIARVDGTYHPTSSTAHAG